MKFEKDVLGKEKENTRANVQHVPVILALVSVWNQNVTKSLVSMIVGSNQTL